MLKTQNFIPPKLAFISETSKMKLLRYVFLETIETPHIILVKKQTLKTNDIIVLHL